MSKCRLSQHRTATANVKKLTKSIKFKNLVHVKYRINMSTNKTAGTSSLHEQDSKCKMSE